METDICRLATSETEPQLVLYFEVVQTPATDYHLFVYRLDGAGQIRWATDYPQPALFWWPTSHWQAGDLRQVRVNTLPWWTGDQAVFGYAIGLSQTTDPWPLACRSLGRLRATRPAVNRLTRGRCCRWPPSAVGPACPIPSH